MNEEQAKSGNFGEHGGDAEKPPLGINISATRTQIEFAAALAYLVGSPLQRSQPTALETIQSSVLLTNQLLEYGVDPERIVALIHSE